MLFVGCYLSAHVYDDILHTLGGQHPDRVGGLVYLEAAEDPTLKLARERRPEGDPIVCGDAPALSPEATACRATGRPRDRRAIQSAPR